MNYRIRMWKGVGLDFFRMRVRPSYNPGLGDIPLRSRYIRERKYNLMTDWVYSPDGMNRRMPRFFNSDSQSRANKKNKYQTRAIMGNVNLQR